MTGDPAGAVPADAARADAAPADAAPARFGDVRVLRGSPTPEETAAVIAVVHAALAEAALEDDDEVVSAGPGAWRTDQRALRTPLLRGGWANEARH